MVKINVRGKEIEISEKVVRVTGPHDECHPPFEKWSKKGYEEALTKVRGALETLDDLKNGYHAKELSPEQLAAKLEHFRNYYAMYTYSVSSRGLVNGNDPTDDWFDKIEIVYDLGGIVCKTAREIANLAKTDR